MDMRSYLLKAMLFLSPLLLLEGAARHAATPSWYQTGLDEVRKAPVDALFVGSSRVAVAVDAELLSRRVTERIGRPYRVLNMGMGYATIIVHYMGLRRMFREHPEHLRGVTVFIETLRGLVVPERWEDGWVYAQQVELIVPYLELPDMWRLWRDSSMNRNDKLFLSASSQSTLLLDWTHRRRRFLLQGEALLDQLLPRPAAPAAELSGKGGVRTDADGVAAARELARSFAAADIKAQQSFGGWESTALKDVVDLVRANGGKVVFFDTPMSEVQAAPYQTALRLRDRQAFQDLVRSWGAELLPVPFASDDTDFPDLWHLRISRVKDYTEALATAYLGRREGDPR